jgi:hypothetical protein
LPAVLTVSVIGQVRVYNAVPAGTAPPMLPPTLVMDTSLG